MTEQQIKELIKEFAYGYNEEQVAEIEEISIDDAITLRNQYAKEIEEKKEQLKEGGWNE